jgi:hypothetical protein
MKWTLKSASQGLFKGWIEAWPVTVRLDTQPGARILSF